MKIQIDNEKLSIAITGLPDTLVQNEVENITGKLYNTLISANSLNTTVSDVVFDLEDSKVITKPPVQQSTPAITKTESPLIRPRIPNNVIDINDLTIEKAVTENALVRCPNCGQAHCLAVPSGNQIYLMRRDFKDNEFGIIAEFDSLTGQDFVNVCCKPETNRKAYYEDLQTMSFLYNTDFTVDNNTEIFCPVCCVSSTFNLWKDAFEHPLDYFETEHLCDACGGEKFEKLLKKKKIYECESCGLQTDFKEE